MITYFSDMLLYNFISYWKSAALLSSSSKNLDLLTFHAGFDIFKNDKSDVLYISLAFNSHIICKKWLKDEWGTEKRQKSSLYYSNKLQWLFIEL